jgi:hypothetical protein
MTFSDSREGMHLEYWETCDSRQGEAVVDIDENGLCVRSPIDMLLGSELGIRVFFSLGHELDAFQALVRIIGKDVCCEYGWELYEYKLAFIRISEQDRLKLKNLTNIRQVKEEGR